MKKSEILIEAQSILCAEEEDWVCLALAAVQRLNYYNTQIELNVDILKEWITDDLLRKTKETKSPYASLFVNNWVKDHHPELYRYLDKNNLWREYRIQWMNWMIKHWQSKGD